MISLIQFQVEAAGAYRGVREQMSSYPEETSCSPKSPVRYSQSHANVVALPCSDLDKIGRLVSGKCVRGSNLNYLYSLLPECEIDL